VGVVVACESRCGRRSDMCIGLDIFTSHVERPNLAMFVSIGRSTWLTNAFSKKIDNDVAAISLYFAYYNCRVHQTSRMTPAMEAGIADHARNVEELVE